MSNDIKIKPFKIPKRIVVEAFKYVKMNKGSAGVDGITIESYEKDLKRNLYKLWNRMSSGSYFCNAVKRVEIPKGNGKTRPLGIPTVEDRIAQTIVKMIIEPKIDKKFSKWSYGYRKGKSGYEAVEEAKRNCWKYDYVVDLDIKGFFDNIDHELMIKAVLRNVEEKWCILYIKRWLKASVEMPDGRVETREKGTPQGGVISPLLANLFLHYVMDKWLEKEYPEIRYERFADDAIIHCKTEKQAKEIREALEKRFKECNLELHPEKTKIAYCKDDNRKRGYSETSFTFMGFEFKARTARNREDGSLFLNFQPAISKEKAEKTKEEIKEMKIGRRTGRSLKEIRDELNPVIRGKMNYYGKFYKTAMYSILRIVENEIKKWYRKKYQKGYKEAKEWAKRLFKKEQSLFVHWNYIKPLGITV